MGGEGWGEEGVMRELGFGWRAKGEFCELDGERGIVVGGCWGRGDVGWRGGGWRRIVRGCDGVGEGGVGFEAGREVLHERLEARDLDTSLLKLVGRAAGNG